ncbi:MULTISPECIES: isochorismatase family protein [Actinomadura]|uniref:Isochorismatase family protein n=1 Tax=Actinomadura yumaensis TaxID=111807 RepID=A0ABW2CCV1_9ACTN|nr:isochorismatase family protein [Actinomadura sp. J1-007]MWK38390.1 isochorismatase family protein [Actinomadura sp. J1-007]
MDPLDADYRAAGFGGTLPFGQRPAVLAIDIVRAYLDRDSPLYAGVEGAVAAAARLVTSARSHGAPVLFTKVEYGPGGRDGGLFYRKVPALHCFERGNPLGDFTEDPSPAPDETVVVKQYASAFAGTSLAATLTAMRIDTVLLCGLSTSGCVRASAVDALQHGFVPFVVRDACGDRDPRPHEANLFDLQAKYAEVVSLETALAALER